MSSLSTVTQKPLPQPQPRQQQQQPQAAAAREKRESGGGGRLLCVALVKRSMVNRRGPLPDAPPARDGPSFFLRPRSMYSSCAVGEINVRTLAGGEQGKIGRQSAAERLERTASSPPTPRSPRRDSQVHYRVHDGPEQVGDRAQAVRRLLVHDSACGCEKALRHAVLQTSGSDRSCTAGAHNSPLRMKGAIPKSQAGPGLPKKVEGLLLTNGFTA